MNESKKPYTSVYKPIAGWKALMISWYAGEDMWDVTTTSSFSFKKTIEYGKQ